MHVQKTSLGSFGKLVLGSLFIAIGVGLTFFWAKPNIEIAKASLKWPQARGTITVSEVNSHRNNDGDKMYSAEVSYSYSVESRSYSNSNIDLGPKSSSSSSSSAHAISNRYPIGSSVSVFYNPTNPAESTLQTGVTTSLKVIYWAGIAFIVVGGLMFLWVCMKLFVLLILVLRSGDTNGGGSNTVTA